MTSDMILKHHRSISMNSSKVTVNQVLQTGTKWGKNIIDDMFSINPLPCTQFGLIMSLKKKA